MLGKLYSNGETDCIEITERVQTINVHGVYLDARVEEKGLLLSKVEVVCDREQQHEDAVLNHLNELKHRREDVQAVSRDIKELSAHLDYEDDEELEQLLQQKRAIRKKHLRTIKQLEARATIQVHFQVQKTGVSALLPAGLNLEPKFLPKPVCWCPYDTPLCHDTNEVEDRCEDMPLSMTSPEQTTASGAGLSTCSPNQDASFVITAKDKDGHPRNTGGDTFLVDAKNAELQYSIQDNQDGKYDVRYTLGDSKDSVSLSVSLCDVPIAGSPFVVARRSLCLFDTGGSKVAISQDKRTASYTGGDHWQGSVYCTPCPTYSFRITGPSQHLMAGFTTTSAINLEGCNFDAGTGYYLYLSDWHLFGIGKRHSSYASGSHAIGTIVTCTWDKPAGTISFALNGQDKGVAYTGVFGELLPAFDFYDPGCSIELVDNPS